MVLDSLIPLIINESLVNLQFTIYNNYVLLKSIQTFNHFLKNSCKLMLLVFGFTLSLVSLYLHSYFTPPLTILKPSQFIYSLTNFLWMLVFARQYTVTSTYPLVLYLPSAALLLLQLLPFQPSLSFHLHNIIIL